jgi:hypothetical protein
MDFDSYLQKYYGFDTNDKKWKRMGTKGKLLLRDSFKMDMAKKTKKTTDETKLAKLYPSNKE